MSEPNISLDELAERVEKLTGPDRSIDWTIHLRNGLEGVGMYGDHPSYTASIDAAMTLVPEGCAWALYSDGPTYKASAEIGKHPSGGELMQGDWIGEGEAPALALTAASLRALSALGGRSQGGEE